MPIPLHTLTVEALALDAADRLSLATTLLDSVEGSADPAWSATWTTELGRRSAAADAREAAGEPRGADWETVRRRLLLDVARR